MRKAIWLLLLTFSAAAAVASVRSVDAPAVDVRRIPNGGFQPDLAVGRDGAIHLVYYGGDSTAGDVFYVRSKDGGATFSAAGCRVKVIRTSDRASGSPSKNSAGEKSKLLAMIASGYVSSLVL